MALQRISFGICVTNPLRPVRHRMRIVWLSLPDGISEHAPGAVGRRNFFPQSRVLRFPDSTSAQTAIARGAAWTAAWLEAFKKPLVNPVISQTIALRVQGRDPIPLVTAGTAIPFPADGEWKTVAGLALPKKFTGTLRIEAITLPEEHVVLNLPVKIDAREAREALNLEFRFGSSHSFECAVALRKRPDDRIVVEAENPLINVSNPGAVRVEIEQIEEDLRDAGGFSARHRDKLMRLAELYRELRMTEKAVDILKALPARMAPPTRKFSIASPCSTTKSAI